jgi:hypothetical protein
MADVVLLNLDTSNIGFEQVSFLANIPKSTKAFLVYEEQDLTSLVEQTRVTHAIKLIDQQFSFGNGPPTTIITTKQGFTHVFFKPQVPENEEENLAILSSMIMLVNQVCVTSNKPCLRII